jgi:hypothetical protein
MGQPTVWCLSSRTPVGRCDTHGVSHREVTSQLGDDDEPRENGAVVMVWAGDYRRQEVWIASGANVGNWYCLGNEFGQPKVWDPPGADFWASRKMPPPPRPAATVPLHPDWFFVLTRGPVSLLAWNNAGAYRTGWRNGRRRLREEIESLTEDDSGGYEPTDG